MKNLVDFFKKTALYLSIPLVILSCSTNKYIEDDIYYSPSKNKEISANAKKDTISSADTSSLETVIISEQELDNIKFVERLKHYPYPYPYFYKSHLDSDFDGITNFNDPWPYKFGPFLDMNWNEFIDFQDMQIDNFWDFNFYYSGFYYNYASPYWNSYWDPFFFYWESPFNHHNHNSPLVPGKDYVYRKRESPTNKTIISPTRRGASGNDKTRVRTTTGNRRINGTTTRRGDTYQPTKTNRTDKNTKEQYNRSRDDSSKQSVRRQTTTKTQQTERRTNSSNNNNTNSSRTRKR